MQDQTNTHKYHQAEFRADLIARNHLYVSQAVTVGVPGLFGVHSDGKIVGFDEDSRVLVAMDVDGRTIAACPSNLEEVSA